MFAFIENLLLKNKAKKILSYVEKVETALTLFQSIDNSEYKNTKINTVAKGLTVETCRTFRYSLFLYRFAYQPEKIIGHF